MVVKTITFDVILRKDPKWKKNRAKSTIQLEEEGFWEVWQLFCSHTTLMIEILKQLEKPSAFPARIEKLKQPQANAVLPDIKQEKKWLKVKIKKVCNSLKKQAEFQNLPGRIYSSAINQVLKMLKSWLEIQWGLLQSISGKKRFLEVVEADAPFAEISDFSWDVIRTEAEAILMRTKREIVKKSGDKAAANDDKQLLKSLLKKYDSTTSILTRRAVIYLLRNKFEVQRKQEKPEKVQEWLEGKRIELERVEKQIPSLPRSRSLSPEEFYDAALEDLIYYPLAEVPILEKQKQLFYHRSLVWLLVVYANFPQRNPQMLYCLLQQVRTEIESTNHQFFDWHDSISDKISQFLRIPKSLPYPIYFGGSDVQAWQLNEENRICFKFNGLGDYLCEVRCDRRQLRLVKYFLEDWQTKSQKENKGKYSGALMLLRSAELLIRPKFPKQDEGQVQVNDRQAVLDRYKLSLHCSFDTDYLTKQGLEQVRQRKIEKELKELNRKKTKLAEQQEQMNQLEQKMQQEQQSSSIKRTKKTQDIKQIEKLKQSIQDLHAEIQLESESPCPKLECLQQSKLFKRADRPLYEGVANLFIGVSLDLDRHLVITVVDAMRQKVLTKRNVKQILGKHYHLLQRFCLLKQEHSRQRQKNQKAGRRNRLSEKGLGKQVACAIANGLIALAQKYKVSTIVLPRTKGWREHLYSQLEARAKIKCRGIKKAMARYTREHGVKLHQWDYNRLSQEIVTEAHTAGIVVLFQQADFQVDIFEQATQRAVLAYDSLQSKDSRDSSEKVDSTA